MIGNVYSMYWLNDYSMYFAKICSKSWDKTVALHVRAWPNRQVMVANSLIMEMLATVFVQIIYALGADVQQRSCTTAY